MDTWVIDVVGNDVERAKAIIRTKVGRYNLKFSVRELPDTRSESEREYDKTAVVLWTLRGFVHKKARFEIYEESDNDSYASK
jgi:hypothetical protein